MNIIKFNGLFAKFKYDTVKNLLFHRIWNEIFLRKISEITKDSQCQLKDVVKTIQYYIIKQ